MSARRTLMVVSAAVSFLVTPGPAAAAEPSPSAPPGREAPRSEPVAPAHPLAGAITVQAEPTGTVAIVSGYWWHNVGQIIVVGEVLNGMSTRRNLVEVRTQYKNSSGAVVATGSTHVLLDRLARGMTSPFLIVKGPDGLPPGVETVVATVTVGQTAQSGEAPRGALQVTVGPPTPQGESIVYHGTVTNSASFAVGSVEIGVTLYNADGDARNVTYPTPAVAVLAPGASTSFTAVLPPLDGTSRVGVAAQARSQADFGTYVTSWNNYFDDIGFTAFRSDILWNAEQGITTGCGTARFCPDASVPRDQMASFLARALKLSGSAPNAFGDDEGNPHEPNINLVAKAGIASGCATGKFCPAAKVARDQMASFLARAKQLSGSAPDAFTDDEGNIHEPNINLVAREAIATGCGTGKYCPAQLVTRGQMAAFLRRAFGK